MGFKKWVIRHYFADALDEYTHLANSPEFRYHTDLMRRLAAATDAQMTLGVLPNSAGAGYFDYSGSFGNNYGNLHQQFEILSTVSGSTPIGTLMEIVQPYTGPGTGASPTLATVQPSSTTADFLLMGVLAGGSTNLSANASTSVPAGKVCNVLRAGVTQILMDATSTAGNPIIQSAATAGAAKTNASAVASKTIGTALQAVTISSGTALVWASIWLT